MPLLCDWVYASFSLIHKIKTNIRGPWQLLSIKKSCLSYKILYEFDAIGYHSRSPDCKLKTEQVYMLSSSVLPEFNHLTSIIAAFVKGASLSFLMFVFVCRACTVVWPVPPLRVKLSVHQPSFTGKSKINHSASQSSQPDAQFLCIIDVKRYLRSLCLSDILCLRCHLSTFLYETLHVSVSYFSCGHFICRPDGGVDETNWQTSLRNSVVTCGIRP